MSKRTGLFLRVALIVASFVLVAFRNDGGAWQYIGCILNFLALTTLPLVAKDNSIMARMGLLWLVPLVAVAFVCTAGISFPVLYMLAASAVGFACFALAVMRSASR